MSSKYSIKMEKCSPGNFVSTRKRLYVLRAQKQMFQQLAWHCYIFVLIKEFMLLELYLSDVLFMEELVQEF